MSHTRIFKVVVPMLVLWGVVYISSAGGLIFFINWHRVAINNDRDRVIELLGSPDQTSNSFKLGQRIGYDYEYEKAKNSGSIYYMSWNKGIDVVFTIGLDNKNKVRVKAYGGT